MSPAASSRRQHPSSEAVSSGQGMTTKFPPASGNARRAIRTTIPFAANPIDGGVAIRVAQHPVCRARLLPPGCVRQGPALGTRQARRSVLNGCVDRKVRSAAWNLTNSLQALDRQRARHERISRGNQALGSRLNRLDSLAPDGAWTFRTLEPLGSAAVVHAGDVCGVVGLETPWFMLNVRKHKYLGLTESIGMGCR